MIEYFYFCQNVCQRDFEVCMRRGGSQEQKLDDTKLHYVVIGGRCCKDFECCYLSVFLILLNYAVWLIFDVQAIKPPYCDYRLLHDKLKNDVFLARNVYENFSIYIEVHK